MPLVTFYFQLHQPFRLHPGRDRFLWDGKNKDVFLRVADKCYLPAFSLFTELIADNPSFKITLSMSGTFLEQAELYNYQVIKSIQDLLDAGRELQQVEILDETYFHSLTGLIADPDKQEFRDQVSLHRDKLRSMFGVFPTSFRNTELMYNNHIADVISDMGYLSILCEKRPDMFMQGDHPISENTVFRAKGNRLIVIPRNRELSDDIAFRFPHSPISPEDYASYLARVDGEVVLLGYDFEHIGEHIWEERGIFNFWRGLPSALSQFPNVVVSTPSEIAGLFQNAECPELDIHGLATSSWADAGRDTFGWLGNPTQYELFKDIEGLEREARQSGGELLTKWRHLTTSDHVYFIHERAGEDQAVHAYFNPYGSIAQPTQILTRKIDYLEMALRRFAILKKREKTAVLMISPETGRLPEGMGGLAKYIFGKSGGQGEVVSALCEGLTERDIHVHLITLNLKRRFREEAQLSEAEWQQLRHTEDPKNVHLVSSSVFADNASAYSGNTLLTAAEFQREVVNNLIKALRVRHEGLIIHSHDWMAGGAITAYARARGLPVLHTVHNVFTADLPLDYLWGVERDAISEYFYVTQSHGRDCLDCQATAIKNATLINFVGERFLREVVDDYFLDKPVVPLSVRMEVKAKYAHEAAMAIINAPSLQTYPERCDHLISRYGPDDSVLQAKKDNLIEFQSRTGLDVDPDAILFYWPSRLDPQQKGVELLEKIALSFVRKHSDVQIAIVADGIGEDQTHRGNLGAIALASQGRITCQSYGEPLSLLGYAAANDVFGASLYEPCGQIDQLGNIFGATATNRDTGGYHDKIRELRLKIDGAPQDVGNGFLFRDYDSGGLWYGLEMSLDFHRR
ncbi:MAG: glycogen/starch synthase, partial [Syntrophales bacterium]|nr:glycogen/starch synthase [Syntrophales bacterium]